MMTDINRRTDLPGRCEGEEGMAKYTSFLKVKSCESDTDGAKLASKTSLQSGVFISRNARREGGEWPSTGNTGQSWKQTSQNDYFVLSEELICFTS